MKQITFFTQVTLTNISAAHTSKIMFSPLHLEFKNNKFEISGTLEKWYHFLVLCSLWYFRFSAQKLFGSRLLIFLLRSVWLEVLQKRRIHFHVLYLWYLRFSFLKLFSSRLLVLLFCLVWLEVLWKKWFHFHVTCCLWYLQFYFLKVFS